MSHVTGGGLAANLARVVPDGVTAHLDRGTWTPHPVFEVVSDAGQVERAELEATLNMGVGMVAMVDRDTVDQALSVLEESGVPAWVCGEVTDGDGDVRMHGDYA
jgi:phosphoribosylformylglycinamidine cyclo-ligase